MNITKELTDRIISRIKDINSRDPNVEGDSVKELIYTERMLDTLDNFKPDADDDLKIACAGQHIQRWEYPRSNYPEGRVGYLKWRKELYSIHADLVGAVIEEFDAPKDFLNSVKDIIQNKVTGKNDSQTLEDIACLVFLEYYLSDFVKKHEEEKLIKIIRSTWNKMSEPAHEKALLLDFKDEHLILIKKAII